MAASQNGAGGAPAGTKRFYERAAIEADPNGFALVLDGRRARTPARAFLVLPNGGLAEAVASEWNAQGATIDPKTLPLTKLANTAIDGVAGQIDAVREDLVRYAGSDLVVYRAGDPERLVAEQSAAWDPVLAWARLTLGARFVLSQGVMFVAQPEETVQRVKSAIEAQRSPFGTAALHVMTTLTGSVLLALMHASGAISVEDAWRAAHVDETFQESRWGLDEEAALRRQNREAEFRNAARFLALTLEGE